MSDQPRKLDDEQGPEAMRAEIDRLYAHMKTHPVDSCRLGIMMFGHETEENGEEGIHICTMMGGKPEILVKAVAELMQKLMDAGPEVKALLILEMVKRQREAEINYRAAELVRKRDAEQSKEPSDEKLAKDSASEEAAKKLLMETFAKHNPTKH